MGIRKIEDEIDLREAMKKKAAELKIRDLQAKASIENFTKERLRELAQKHGVILALTPELKEEIRELQEKYNIPSSKIITEQITEHDVLKKFFKIDHEKLGMLAYQRVLLQKEEIGAGLMPILEVFELVHTGILKNNIDMQDLIKAMKILMTGWFLSSLLCLNIPDDKFFFGLGIFCNRIQMDSQNFELVLEQRIKLLFLQVEVFAPLYLFENK